MREKLIEILETVVSPKELLCDGEVLVSTARVADHLIANGVTVQKWIPVTERLPEQGDVVLIYTKHEDIQVFQWDDNYGGWVGDRYNYSKRMVTHWMPLPEPPKEGADHG